MAPFSDGCGEWPYTMFWNVQRLVSLHGLFFMVDCLEIKS